jgi:hypothetical protein
VEGNMTLNDYYVLSSLRFQKTNERFGQSLFNTLEEINPILADKVRGTNNDPFYASLPQDIKVKHFIKFIEKNWI